MKQIQLDARPLSGDDKELWQRFKQGDKVAFATIYRQHVQILFRYGMSICTNEEFVQDCLHDVFLEVWTKRERISDTDSIKFYLIKSLKNRIIKQVGKVQHLAPTELIAESSSGLLSPSHEDEWIDTQDELHRIDQLTYYFDKLSARQREALQLRFFDELTYQQIAEILQINQQSAYNLIFRALEELRKHLLILLAGALSGLLTLF